MSLRRKLYVRGSSFETTIPMPLLFSLDRNLKHDVVFDFDERLGKWTIEIVASKSVSQDAQQGNPIRKERRIP